MEPNGIIFLAVFTAFVIAPGQEASRKAMDAYYKQSGIETAVNQYGDKQLKQVPDEAKFYLGHIAFISKCISERRIVFEWRF